MHESMSVMSGSEWAVDRTTSYFVESLTELDKTIADALETAKRLVNRLDIVLQPEAPSEEKEGNVLPLPPTSLAVHRVREASGAVHTIIRILDRAMERLDT